MTEYEKTLVKSMELEICDNCVYYETGEKCGLCPVHQLLSLAKKDDKDDLINWMHDDITWCRRTNCPNKECFRNQVNRRLRAGLISVADMYKEGKCPKEATLD